MSKPTPGPWSCIVEGNDAFVMPAGGSPCVTLIKLRGAGTSYSESLANARLIAAAPDLLQTLRSCVSVLRAAHMHKLTIPNLVAHAESVIVKATREGA